MHSAWTFSEIIRKLFISIRLIIEAWNADAEHDKNSHKIHYFAEINSIDVSQLKTKRKDSLFHTHTHTFHVLCTNHWREFEFGCTILFSSEETVQYVKHAIAACLTSDKTNGEQFTTYHDWHFKTIILIERVSHDDFKYHRF